jgi:hypothetical protein
MLKYGLSTNPNETIQETVEKSVEMEKLGFDYVWVSNTSSRPCFHTIASNIAERTSNIRVGVGLLSPLLYTPSQIVKSIATLTKLYGNRFELCIGPGDRNQLRKMGFKPSELKHIPELLLRVKREVDEGLSQEGLGIPIWLGAQGPRMLKIAKFFQHVLINYADIDLIKWALEEMNLPYINSVQLGIYAPSYVYTYKDSQLYHLLKVSSTTVALGTTRSVLEKIGLYGEIIKIREELKRGYKLKDVVDRVPEEVVERFSIYKSSNALSSYILKLREIGVKHIVFGYPQNISKETIRTLALSLPSRKI